MACEQVYLGRTPPEEQLEHHSLGATPLCWVQTTPGQGVGQLTVGTRPELDLGINHWTSVYVSLSLRSFPLLIYTTVVVLSDSSRCLVEDFLLQMQEGQADCPEL